MSGREKLLDKHDLAEMFGCEPRAVVRMAAKGAWPSTKVLGQYKFTDEMVQAIIALHERWPDNKPAAQPKQDKTQSPRPRAPRTRDANLPAPLSTSNLRPLVAKRARRSA
jgi:hypothetical protein